MSRTRACPESEQDVVKLLECVLRGDIRKRRAGRRPVQSEAPAGDHPATRAPAALSSPHGSERRRPSCPTQCPPHPLRSSRHFDLLGIGGVGDRVHEGGGSADETELSHPLRADRVVSGGNVGAVQLDVGEVVGARKRVVHQRVRQQLSQVVLDTYVVDTINILL